MGRFSSLTANPAAATPATTATLNDQAILASAINISTVPEFHLGDNAIASSAASTSIDVTVETIALEMAPPTQSSLGEKHTNTGKRLIVNRVENVSGSTAGAGSSEFDKYRKAKRREQDRLEDVDKRQREDAERDAYHAKVLRNKMEDEERTRKNAEKRRKKKLVRKTKGGGGEGKKDEVDMNGNLST